MSFSIDISFSDFFLKNVIAILGWKKKSEVPPDPNAFCVSLNDLQWFRKYTSFFSEKKKGSSADSAGCLTGIAYN